MNLQTKVANMHKWPTPTANNFVQNDVDALLERRERVKVSSNNGNGFGLTLANAVAIATKYPTPCSTDHKGSGKTGELRDRLDYAVERGGTKSATFEVNPVGQLNPDWEERLMGWPIGHTNLSSTTTRMLDWQQDPANLPVDHRDYIPRTALHIKNRPQRVKCIGNGQVSLAMATAFVILAERLGA